MSLQTLDKAKLLTSRPRISLIYGNTGVGKTVLCWTSVCAGYTPYFVTTEMKEIAEWMIDMVFDAGGHFAYALTPKEWSDIFPALKAEKGKYDMLILDGMTAGIMGHLTRTLPGASNTQAVYGSNMSTVLTFMMGLQTLGIPVVLTALEKVDRLYSGGVTFGGQGNNENDRNETKSEKEKYMPNFPGQLETLVSGIGCDLVGRMTANGPTRTLLLEPSSMYFSRIPTGYSMKNIPKPTIHKLFEGVKGTPQPRITAEETIKLLEGVR